jgi:hypothetical protein
MSLSNPVTVILDGFTKYFSNITRIGRINHIKGATNLSQNPEIIFKPE